MHYIDEGDASAAPVVLLHGEPTWGYLWRRFIGPLSTDHRVIVPDHMGFGKSETPSDRKYDADEHVDNLEALLIDDAVRRGPLPGVRGCACRPPASGSCTEASEGNFLALGEVVLDRTRRGQTVLNEGRRLRHLGGRGRRLGAVVDAAHPPVAISNEQQPARSTMGAELTD